MGKELKNFGILKMTFNEATNLTRFQVDAPTPVINVEEKSQDILRNRLPPQTQDDNAGNANSRTFCLLTIIWKVAYILFYSKSCVFQCYEHLFNTQNIHTNF